MHTLHLSNSPMLKLLLVLKQNNKQNKQGNSSMGFKLHNNLRIENNVNHMKEQLSTVTPNGGIKYLKLEECEHLEISLRLNTQFQTTLPQSRHKAHYTSTRRKNELNRPVEPLFGKCRSLPLMCLEYNKGSLKT